MMEINNANGTLYYTDLTLFTPKVVQRTLEKAKNKTIVRETQYELEISNESHFEALRGS